MLPWYDVTITRSPGFHARPVTTRTPCKLKFSVNANSVMNGCFALEICRATVAGVRFWILWPSVGIRQCSSWLEDKRNAQEGVNRAIACRLRILQMVYGPAG